MRDQRTDTPGHAVREQEPGPVELVKTGVDHVFGIPDAVQPCRGNQNLAVGW